MKKTILLPLITLFLSAAASAADNSALAQLGLLPEPAIEFSPVPYPAAPKGGALSQISRWDPDAPFMHCERPAEVAFQPGGAVIKNMRWGTVPADKQSYDWTAATVKPELLEKVFYGYKTMGVGHSFFVFVFKAGGITNDRGETTSAFTAGAEGWAREPHGYNVFHATAGKYPLIWSVTTLGSYADYTVNLRESELFLTPIALDRAQALELLSKTLERINQTNARKEIYESFSNNCTTNPVDLLNAVLPPAQHIKKTAFLGLANPDFTFPRYAVKRYTELGVISPSAIRIDQSNIASFNISSY